MRVSMSSDGFDRIVSRVSSGQRINRAADDPAGLTISEKLRSQIGGLSQDIKNNQDRISMLQVKDSALASVNDSMQHIRELKVQAENGTYTAEDKARINEQVDELRKDIGNTIDTCTYNGRRLIEDALGDNSLDSIDSVDRAISSVSSQRSEVGSEQNRLEHDINNEMVAHENLSASESNIRDADIAMEMMRGIKNGLKDQVAVQFHANLNRKNALMLLME